MWSPKLIETICVFFGEQVLVGTHGVDPPSLAGRSRGVPVGRRCGWGRRRGRVGQSRGRGPLGGAAGGLAGTAGPAGAFLDRRSYHGQPDRGRRDLEASSPAR